MPPFEPIVSVLLYSSLAALAAGVGALPQALRGGVPHEAVGWANALASGLMLGVAYTLLTLGLDHGTAAGGIGALLGIGFVRATHAVTGTAELDLLRLEDAGPGHGYRALLAETLHAAHEGVAIGVAMLMSIPLGISVALTLAVHNVPEGMVLTDMVTRTGGRPHHAAGLAVAANINLVLLAVATYVVVGAMPALMPWAAGFAVGALLYLVLVELLPESYRQAGHTSIALVTVAAMVMVVLLAPRP